jgi:Anti-sigma-K factor rskA
LPDSNGHLDLAAYDLDREEYRELEQAAGLLGLAAPEARPPARLAAQVLIAVDQVAEPAPRRRLVRRRLGRPALALAGAAAMATAAVALVLGRSVATDDLELRAALESRTGSASASVEVRKTGIGRVVTFRSATLPILPKGDYYELWFVGPGDTRSRPNRISAGTFHPDEKGRSNVRFAAAVDPALYPTLSVTAEPGDGDPRPTGPEVLRSSR